MKAKKAFLIIFFVFVICLATSTLWAQATDLSIWVGNWLKITEKGSGFEFDGSGITKFNYHDVLYWKVIHWDQEDKILSFEITQYEDGAWWKWELDLYFIAGTDLDFLCWANVYNGAFAARITGTKKGEGLKTAKFTTLGGFNTGVDETLAQSLSFTGKLIPESKLPPDMPK